MFHTGNCGWAKIYYPAVLVTLSYATVYGVSEDGQAWIMERYVIQPVPRASEVQF